MEKVRFGVIGIGNMGTSHSGWLVGNRIRRGRAYSCLQILMKKEENGQRKIFPGQ